ncbi:MAG: TIGR03790 family protein, partial [Akkermansiaceae bacterium]|nr:TIGR03790 family protein [Akkermansiaceae bacterium]
MQPHNRLAAAKRLNLRDRRGRFHAAFLMSPTPPSCCRLAGLLLLLVLPLHLQAGGGPFHTLVVVNTNSADSVELGAYYAERHGIPPHHVCRLGLATNLETVTSNEFQSLLIAPITNHIATNGLAGRINVLVLCQAFPTRVRDVEGLGASFFYGFKNAPGTFEAPVGCKLPAYTSNTYFRAERTFRSADGWNATNGFIAFHLVASNLVTAKLVVDRGVAAQAAFPPASVYLHNLGDWPRGVREPLYANVQFSFAALPGLPAACFIAGPYDLLASRTNVIGYQDGFAYIPATTRATNNVWLPGAYADHLTSLGGRIPKLPTEPQDNVTDWMAIGATASYGTVAEPCNYPQKFPDPLLGFYTARGFALGEAYAMSVSHPYQGIFAGDPLAAPFAAPPVVTVDSHAPLAIVTGAVTVAASAVARSNGVPAAALDWYLDGRFQAQLAAVNPTPGNILSLAVAGITKSTTVTTNDSLFDAVSNLAAAVNADPSQLVAARAFGDRLEVVYQPFNRAGDWAPVAAAVAPGAAADLTLGIGHAATNLVPSIYPARKYVYLATHTSAGANANDTLTCIVTLTNGVAVTNVLVAAQGERVTNILQRLAAAINTNAVLMATNGVFYSRLAQFPVSDGTFFARTPGPGGFGIQLSYVVTAVSNSSGLRTNSNLTGFFDDHPDDVRARAAVLFHVRPTGGVLSATALLDTTNLTDGIHTLDFVARDGSAVAAESRLTLPLVVGNSSPQLSVIGTNGVALTNGAPPALATGADFGAVPWSQARTNVFAIRNNGSVALSITNWTTHGPGASAFQVMDVPLTVDAGSASNFAVVFAPAAVGSYAAALAFDSDALLAQTNILFAGTGARRDQAIDFPPISGQVGTDTVILSATASSGLPVAFTVASGPAQIADFTNLTFTGSGTVAIAAAQAGDANWDPAPSVTNAFQVAPAPAMVFLQNLSQTYNGAARSVTATTDPAGLVVEFTYDGNHWSPTNAGIYTVTGTINDALYAGSAAGLLEVTPAPAAVFLQDLSQTYDGAARSVTATTDPTGLVVEFTYDGHPWAPTNAGIYTVTGAIAELNWTGSDTGTLAIARAGQTIDFPPVLDQVGTNTLILSATAGSGLPVAFTVASGPAQIADFTNLTFTGSGTVAIAA